MKNIDPVFELLWNGLPQPKRGPRPTLSLPIIAAAGVELADEGGLAALTMEAVAQRLGLTKMALYRYVPGRAELVALMVEAAIGEPLPAFRAGGRAKSWRALLRAWAHALFEKFSAHPWALEATLGTRPVGPNEVAWLESALAALVETGLRGADKLDAVVTLLGHVRHLVQQTTASEHGDGEQAFLAAMRELTQGRAASFPALTHVLSERAPKHARGAALDFGLECIFDGLELQITRAQTRRKPR
jgi:AcrR family transcriptional regulator